VVLAFLFAPVSCAQKASSLTLHAVSTLNLASEMGGAFMHPSRCDADGNLYIRKLATDRPLLGPIVKIDPDGKRVASFDPTSYAQLGLIRADSFSPAADGGLYQIAQSGVAKPRVYVLHFSSDGAVNPPTRLDADFEVFTFAAFAGGNFLVSGLQRDPANHADPGRNFTAVFSADGRELAQLKFPGRTPASAGKTTGETKLPLSPAAAPVSLDLAEAEAGSDGNLYVLRRSSPALVFVIAPSGDILRTLKIQTSLSPGGQPIAFHLSENRIAIAFRKTNDSDQKQTDSIVVADAQTGRKIAAYTNPLGSSSMFACYAANEGVFTFLELADGNAFHLTRAVPQ
jgi:hypothetical protein